MIFGNINNENEYNFISKNEKLKTALDYIKQGNYPSIENEKLFLNDDIFLFLKKANTKEYTNRYEAHKNYLDIFYLIKGTEDVYVSKTIDMNVSEEYNPEKDIMFGQVNYYQKITMHEGDYIIVFPEDAHAPIKGNGDPIEQLVIKVKK